jgi:hypothetical protein
MNISIRCLSFAPITLVGLLACGDAPTSGGEDTAKTSAAILNGTPVTNDVLGSPIVCASNNGTSCNMWGCSGTMVADRWLLTAHHCVTQGNVLTGGTAIPANEIYTWLQTTPHAVTGQAIFLHPSLDAALVLLSSSLVDGNGVARTTPIYTGSSAGLVGKTVYCQGWGDTSLSAGYGNLTSAYLTVGTGGPGSLTLNPNGQGQALYEGDSGAGCFLGAPGSSPNAVVSVHSEASSPGIGVTYDIEVGADGFESWAAGVIAQNACSLAGAACGNITDGLGQVVSCGGCGVGDVCQQNACVCAPQQCKFGTWNQASCRCEIPCHTVATCCAQNGGYWDGKYCE